MFLRRLSEQEPIIADRGDRRCSTAPSSVIADGDLLVRYNVRA